MSIVFTQKALNLLFVKILVCFVICKSTFEAPFNIIVIRRLIESVLLLLMLIALVL